MCAWPNAHVTLDSSSSQTYGRVATELGPLALIVGFKSKSTIGCFESIECSTPHQFSRLQLLSSTTWRESSPTAQSVCKTHSRSRDGCVPDVCFSPCIGNLPDMAQQSAKRLAPPCSEADCTDGGTHRACLSIIGCPLAAVVQSLKGLLCLHELFLRIWLSSRREDQVSGDSGSKQESHKP